MPVIDPADQDTPGLGELARRVRDIFTQFQNLSDRLQTVIITKEYFTLFERSLDERFRNLANDIGGVRREVEERMPKLPEKADKVVVEDLERRISALEDSNKWLVRLVIGMVITGVVTVVLFSSNHIGVTAK